MSPDVVVVGLGGMGSAAAYHLARRGISVLGVEQFSPGHDRGSSHGGTRIIRQSYFEDPAYVPLLLRAYELWEQLGQDSGRDVHQLTGGLYLGPEHSTTFAGSLAAARQWGLPHEVLTSAEVHRRFPAFAPPTDQLGVFEAAGGFARPEETVLAHVELAERAGAELRFGTTVTGWTDHGDHVAVETSAGTLTAGQLLVCPGAWAPDLLADLDLGIRIERQVMYWIEPAAGAPDLTSLPVYIQENTPDEGGDVEQIYGFPAVDGPGGGAKVAFFRRGGDCHPETIDRTVHAGERAAMIARAAQLLPALGGEVLSARTCMYSTTPDEHFVISRHPRSPSVTVACGFSGHGFKFVPVVGEVLADLVQHGRTDHPIDLFDPARLEQR